MKTIAQDDRRYEYLSNNKILDIEKEIKEVLNDSFEKIKNDSLENYTLLIADAEYTNQLKNSKLNPYVIESAMKIYEDETRLKLQLSYLNKVYSNNPINDDSIDNIDTELKIYTHIWESQYFLKKISLIAKLLKGEKYDWKEEVIYDRSKYRKKISKNLKASDSPLSYLIKDNFNHDIRDAFAHSLYRIDNDLKYIEIRNPQNINTSFKRIGIEDWTKYFVYSAMLSYSLYQVSTDRVRNFDKDTGHNKVLIHHPNEDSIGYTERYIYYSKRTLDNKEYGMFNWKGTC